MKRYIVVDERGREIEEFDSMREAEKFCEYKEKWGHNYDIIIEEA